VVSFTPQPLYPRERAPGTLWIGGWVDPRAVLDDPVALCSTYELYTVKYIRCVFVLYLQ